MSTTDTKQCRTVLNKAIRYKVKNDYREYAARKAREAAEKAMSIKRTFASARLKTIVPEYLTKSDGTVIRNSKDMEEKIKAVFQNLFSTKIHVNPYLMSSENDNDDSDKDVWRVLESEVTQAIHQTKSGKAPGPNQIRPERMKCLQEFLPKPLADLFTEMH